ncbi:MAG: DNA-3-methyladenine glycosylase I [Pseudomonadota bacterium]
MGQKQSRKAITEAPQDIIQRCSWVPADDPLYCAYHDEEWGVPEWDDRALFEKLILDGFQAGLSWRTILYKRDNFRRAFDGFDPEKMARYKPKKIDHLLQDKGIIRSNAKINAAVSNAQCYLQVMNTHRGGFSDYLWDFVGGAPIVNNFTTSNEVPAQSPQSVAMSKDLKARGFKFCGPVICYAFMQAVGMVNDHTVLCPRHKAVQNYSKP